MEPPFGFAPHQAGVRELVRRVDRWQATLGTTPGIVGLEPTGRYHEALVRAFAAVSWAVRLLTPNAVAAERRADQRRAKSDPTCWPLRAASWPNAGRNACRRTGFPPRSARSVAPAGYSSAK
ncbi:MAG: IS110 family transposase [Firmicutes bacterium]|nr:IS110 family transposase [Bacillota bacterium]